MKKFIETFMKHADEEGFKALLFLDNHDTCKNVQHELVLKLPGAIGLRPQREVRMPSGARIILRHGNPHYVAGYSVAQVGVLPDHWTNSELEYFKALLRRYDGGQLETLEFVDLNDL